jgi:hypothetical protein
MGVRRIISTLVALAGIVALAMAAAGHLAGPL